MQRHKWVDNSGHEIDLRFESALKDEATDSLK